MMPIVSRVFNGALMDQRVTASFVQQQKRLRGKTNELILLATVTKDPETNILLQIGVLSSDELAYEMRFEALMPFATSRQLRLGTRTDWMPQPMTTPMLLEPSMVRELALADDGIHPTLSIVIGTDAVLSWFQRTSFPSFPWPTRDLSLTDVARLELLLSAYAILVPDDQRLERLGDAASRVATTLAFDLAHAREERDGCRHYLEDPRNDDGAEIRDRLMELRRCVQNIAALSQRIRRCGLSDFPVLRDVLAATFI